MPHCTSTIHRRGFLRQALPLMAAAGAAHAEDWPQFRGPSGQGHSVETELPLKWSGSQNVRWKVPLPGAGWSSPSIVGDRIWLTTATDKGSSLRLLALDRQSGKLLQNTEVFQIRDKGPGIHQKNSFASPTAIVSGDRVFVHYGFYGTACLKTNGEIVWKQTLKYEPQHGPGGSPALFEDLLIFSCDGFDAQFVVALDAATGKIRWKTPRGKGNQAYTTPLVMDHKGTLQVVSPGANRAYAYDPRTGKELWYIEYGDGFSNVPRAVYAHGLVYICSGFFQPVIFAVRPDGKGNVTKSHVAWQHGRAVPLTPSPIVVGGELFMVSDNGIATCLDAQTGAQHWQQRLGGNHSASPVFADGRIYFLSEEGESVVVAPGKQYRELARNTIPERTLASFAVSGKAIYVRGDQHLYRIEA